MANINFKGTGPIDYDKIRAVIESMEDDCRICNHNERKIQGKLCQNCCFRSNSVYKYADGSQRTRVYPSKKIFGQYGLINLPALGKHMFFHFLDNEEMQFTHFELPDVDLWDKISKEKAIELGIDPINGKNFLWHIHHENEKYWDDRECNRLLCLNTEHPLFAIQNKH